MAKQIEIKASVAKLRAMIALEQKFYGTPNGYEPYISSHPNWRDDIVLATPYDVVESAGWDTIEDCDQPGCNDNCAECAEIITLKVRV